MEVLVPMSTFLKIQNEISSLRLKFLDFSIFGPKNGTFDRFSDQKLKNLEILISDLKFHSVSDSLGKLRMVLKLSFPII